MIAKGEATVVKNAGSHYLLSALPEWNLFPAVLRGKIRLKASEITNPIAVGDRVLVQASPSYSYYVTLRAIEKGEDDRNLEISRY